VNQTEKPVVPISFIRKNHETQRISQAIVNKYWPKGQACPEFFYVTDDDFWREQSKFIFIDWEK